MKRLDVISIGRCSVDLYGQQIGSRLEDVASFAKSVGGCPANIAIGTARLGLKSGLITRVGDEQMGRFVKEQMGREGVALDGVWEGTWPPHARVERRRRYRVTSRVLRGSRRRLEAFEAIPGGSWRRFGVSDATVEPGDRRAVERFFADVATSAAQRVAPH